MSSYLRFKPKTSRRADNPSSDVKSINRHDVLGPLLILILVFSGVFKSMPAFSSLPVDFTLLAIILTTTAMLAKFARHKGNLRFATWTLCFSVLALGWLQPAASDYAESKRIGIAITLLAMAGTAYLLDTLARRKVWIWGHVVIAIVLVLTSQDDAVGRFGANTISAGRVSGVSAVILVTLLLTGGIKGFPRVCASIAVITVMVGVLIATGSRGPVLATAMATLGVAALSRRRGRLVRILSAILAATCGWMLLRTSDGAGASRIQRTLDGQIDGTATRSPRWTAAWDNLGNHPFGIGWGNFSDLAHIGSGARDYPHNVLLEVFLEGGWLVGAAVLLFMAVSLVRLARNSNAPYSAALLGIAIFSVANAMLSGDVNDNRAMWSVLVIGYLSPLDQQATKRKNESQEALPQVQGS